MNELEAVVVEVLREDGILARVATIKIGYPKAVNAKRIFIGSKLTKTEFCFRIEDGLLKDLDGFFEISLANPRFTEELKRCMRWLYFNRTATRAERERVCRSKAKS